MVQEVVDERLMHGAWEHPAKTTCRHNHEIAVRNIVEELYAFPTPEYPHFFTFVNVPEVQQRIFTNYGRELAPDIVVLQWPEKQPVIIGEVVTPDMLTEENAQNVWAVEANLEGVQFYLYVPAGHLQEVKRLLKKAKIKEKDVGMRTWRNIVGLETVDVAAFGEPIGGDGAHPEEESHR